MVVHRRLEAEWRKNEALSARQFCCNWELVSFHSVVSADGLPKGEAATRGAMAASVFSKVALEFQDGVVVK